MIRKIRDDLQRLWLALRLTLTGETVERTTFSRYWDWLERAEELLRALIHTLKKEPRSTHRRIRYDGRQLSPTTAIRWLAFSFQRELPSLLRSGNPFARAAFQAHVLNLRDLVSQWHEMQPADSTNSKAKAALSALHDHLQELPAGDNANRKTVVAEDSLGCYPNLQERRESNEPVMREVPPTKPGEIGQGLLEYALILVLVAVVIIVILVLLGPTISQIINNIVNSVSTP